MSTKNHKLQNAILRGYPVATPRRDRRTRHNKTNKTDPNKGVQEMPVSHAQKTAAAAIRKHFRSAGKKVTVQSSIGKYEWVLVASKDQEIFPEPARREMLSIVYPDGHSGGENSIAGNIAPTSAAMFASEWVQWLDNHK